ncbi:MAG: hypothetical protein SAK29_42450, partial [Scytonema sp. PMC 1069.18]|nr:hypothetical protein [Scytonema sp. PMC 1069.18]
IIIYRLNTSPARLTIVEEPETRYLSDTRVLTFAYPSSIEILPSHEKSTYLKTAETQRTQR